MALQPNQASEASAAANRRAHLKEVTSEPAPDSLGAFLRASRLKLEADLRDASKVTKIKPEYLEALEEGRLEALPGRTYAIGFVRTYAQFLGIDAGACVARLKAENPVEQPVEETQNLGLPEVSEEMRVPQGTLIIVIVLVLLAIYGGVYLFRSANDYMEQRAQAPLPPVSTEPVGPAPSAGSQPAETLEATSSEASATPEPSTEASGATTSEPAASKAKPAPAASDAAETTEPAIPATAPTPKPTAPIRSEPEAAEQAPAEAERDRATAPAVSTRAAARPTAEAPPSYERVIASAPRTFGSTTKENRVVLRAKDQVFVRVETEGATNQVLFEGVLNTGELYFVPPKAGVVLVTRNGGALDLYVDGVDKGPAGPGGIALKGLPLNADSLQARP